MIRKYVFGSPFDTEAVIKEFPVSTVLPDFIKMNDDNLSFAINLEADDVIYGLGESVRGINKRGYTYTSNCTDDFSHTEDKSSLYGAHNFVLVDGKDQFGLFVD